MRKNGVCLRASAVIDAEEHFGLFSSTFEDILRHDLMPIRCQQIWYGSHKYTILIKR